jgi:hypothetical protein
LFYLLAGVASSMPSAAPREYDGEKVHYNAVFGAEKTKSAL